MAKHTSVLLKESIEGLNIQENGLYVDGTFGRGGHSHAILDALGTNGQLMAIDKDPDAIAWAEKNFSADRRFSIHHGSFSELEHILASKNKVGQVDGILLDLGVSSPQLDEAQRGFSFQQDGPLDMRMNTRSGLSAETFVNTASVEDMAKVFKDYGEERFAKRIARSIESAREKSAIRTTLELASIVKEAHPKWEKHKHPATRVFQAIRIYVNAELIDLELFLAQAYACLRSGGRLAVISFHSLEDRIVKNFFRDESKGKTLPKEIPIQHEALDIRFRTIGKAMKAKADEVDENVRSRSAVLRIGEKI